MPSLLLIPEMHWRLIIMSMQLESCWILQNLKWALFYYSESILVPISMFVFTWLQIFFHVNSAIFKLYLDFKKLKLICSQITLVHSFLKSNQCIEFLYWKKCSLHVSWSLICVKSNYKQFLITSLPNPF